MLGSFNTDVFLGIVWKN